MLELIDSLKAKGKIIGFTASTADLGHCGFLLMLKEAKNNCDFLIFGLLSDPTIDRPNIKNSPIETLFERWIRVTSCKYIDMVIPFSTEKDLENMINVIKPHIRFVGEEYKDDLNHTGRNIPDVQIVYNERRHDWSSSSLREKIYYAEKQKRKE